MSKLYNKILLASIVILSGSLVLETRVVAEVSAPADTQPANSTAQSVPLTAVFSLIHLVIFTIVMRLAGARLGIGYIATLVAYLVIFILLVKRIGHR